MTKIINRPIYTKRITPFINKPVIKVLTGQRRVGKSYVILQLMDHIRKSDPEANIVYLNMELEEWQQSLCSGLSYHPTGRNCET